MKTFWLGVFATVLGGALLLYIEKSIEPYARVTWFQLDRNHLESNVLQQISGDVSIKNIFDSYIISYAIINDGNAPTKELVFHFTETPQNVEVEPDFVSFILPSGGVNSKLVINGLPSKQTAKLTIISSNHDPLQAVTLDGQVLDRSYSKEFNTLGRYSAIWRTWHTVLVTFLLTLVAVFFVFYNP